MSVTDYLFITSMISKYKDQHQDLCNIRVQERKKSNQVFTTHTLVGIDRFCCKLSHLGSAHLGWCTGPPAYNTPP